MRTFCLSPFFSTIFLLPSRAPESSTTSKSLRTRPVRRPVEVAQRLRARATAFTCRTRSTPSPCQRRLTCPGQHRRAHTCHESGPQPTSAPARNTMEHPAGDIGRVLRELCQSNTKAVEHAVDKYFTDDAQLVGTFRVRSRSGPPFSSGAVAALTRPRRTLRALSLSSCSPALHDAEAGRQGSRQSCLPCPPR